MINNITGLNCKVSNSKHENTSLVSFNRRFIPDPPKMPVIINNKVKYSSESSMAKVDLSPGELMVMAIKTAVDNVATTVKTALKTTWGE